MTEVSFADFWELFGPAVMASCVAAALSGLLGVFVVLRRVAFVSAALGQLAGLGVAGGFLLGIVLGHDPHEPSPLWLDPVVHALILCGVGAALLAMASRSGRAPPETVVAFSYLAAASLALLALASPSIVQEAHEVGDLLFGNTVAVRHEHLMELIAVAVVVAAYVLFFFRTLLFVSFDRDMASAAGLPGRRLELLLNVGVGISVAVATRAIGALPVFGFLVLPAGAALLAFESVTVVAALSVLGAVLAAAGGFYLSFLESWPTGPMMVVVAAAYWPLAWGVRLLRSRLAV